MATDANDMELLHEYVRDHSEQAFRTLVDRHVHLVYRLALRQTGQAQLAQDVTQAVFVVLAEKAATLRPETVLAGWLYRATRFAAANALRAEMRREHWERKAAQVDSPNSPDPEAESIAPMLDEALEQLPEQDRTAILLRFFQSKSIEEIGRTLGTTENAAKMRLSRAMDKLREIFRQRGVVVPTATVLALLSAQASHAAPAGLSTAIATSALLNQAGSSTFTLAKGTLNVMAQAKAKKLAVVAAILLFGGATAVVVQQTLTRTEKANPAAEAKGFTGPATANAVAAAPTSPTGTNGKVLIFRNRPSWNRQPDFEDTLVDLGVDFEVKPAELMATADLASYRAIIIPGAQSTGEFYSKYIENAARFDDYVTNGGTLLLELNGAERSGLVMPRGVTMVLSPARDNVITLKDHPAVIPHNGRPVRANFASHGYLGEVPADATVLATEAVDGESLPEKPTYIEYASGKGRVVAACQCFHDRDGSGRGPWMPAALSYVAEKNWYSPPRQ